MTARRSATSSLLALLAAGAALAACSVEENYRVLSFFFDGVPDPDAPVPELELRPVAVDPAEFARMTPEERAGLLGRRIKAPTVYFHKPVAERRCEECHAIERVGGNTSFPSGVPTLVVPLNQLCFRCHDDKRGKRYVHGPVASGLCTVCHHPHQSSNPFLLRAAVQADLCEQCHVGELFWTREQHAQYGDTACSACHDPHTSERAMLLRPEEELPPGSGDTEETEAQRDS